MPKRATTLETKIFLWAISFAKESSRVELKKNYLAEALKRSPLNHLGKALAKIFARYLKGSFFKILERSSLNH